MSPPELYLSKPGVSFPETLVDNEETIRRVRERYKGPDRDWPMLQAAIEKVFSLCNTRQRFLEPDFAVRVADHAVAAARHCLRENRATLDEVDLVICGGIARQYFEPATAMEIAAKLGLSRTHALDVTSACVGHLEALQVAAAYLQLHPHYRAALVCTSELYRAFLSYDIQSVEELRTKAAGLTVGSAAACFLLRKHPWPDGGMRLRSFTTHTEPKHWHLCQVPIDGTFVSSSVDLVRLGKLIPPLLRQDFEAIGWSPTDVDHYVFHQPSESMVRQILLDTGADPARGVYTHHKYANTASAAVGVTMHEMLKERDVKPGDKLVLGSAAAGFSVVVITGEWTRGQAVD